jgi:hypothetical protein
MMYDAQHDHHVWTWLYATDRKRYIREVTARLQGLVDGIVVRVWSAP